MLRNTFILIAGLPCFDSLKNFQGILSDRIPVSTKDELVSLFIKDGEYAGPNELFCGQLFKTVHPDDSVWTIEDGCVLDIILSKAEYEGRDTLWEALLKDGSFQPDPQTLHEMRKKLDLEKFQIENPGMDFSRAKLSKCYDQLPGSASSAKESLN